MLRWLSVVLVAAMLLPSFDADARRRRRRRRKVARKAEATAQQKVAYNKLLGRFKWGMKADKVVSMLEQELRDSYKKKMRKERDAIKQDGIRRELHAAIKKLKQNYVKFTGKRTRWDVSMVEHEYAHKNNESMVVRWGKRDRRFYFFHYGKLWKVYVAFNSELFRGKSFHDFVRVMEKRFGKGEAKFKMNVKKESVLSHIEWPPAGNTMLKAIDETAFYANFCLVLSDKMTGARVKEGRHLNSPKKKSSDPLVDAVTRKGSGTRDPNSSIVDEITGKGTRRPTVGTGSSGSASPSRTTPAPRKKARPKKKINPKDPLGGLDI
ncbi:MAG: hypothetical protein CSA24_02205 [Deltaproteobacteria bacterium]|nr:MAG: hypothetical protein CSB49_05480 [Pseudomonadota bacterium]PIE65690.1 MAG: hypothetical protein CSA24_02205 [Deltaproteobacteria bacterium]